MTIVGTCVDLPFSSQTLSIIEHVPNHPCWMMWDEITHPLHPFVSMLLFYHEGAGQHCLSHINTTTWLTFDVICVQYVQ